MNKPRLVSCLLASAVLSLTAQADFHDHIGMQTWSLRETTKTKGFLASLDQIKAWGLVEVEGSLAVPGMTAEQVRAAMDERGLKMVSAHVGYDEITKHLDQMVQNAKVLGVKYAICPWIPHDDKTGITAAQIEQAVKDFNRAGAAFRAIGVKFGDHPHGYESLPGTKPGTTMLDDLITGCDPANVCFEMDVFWIVHGGWDPVTMLKKYSGRWMGLHIKDIRKGAPTGFHTGHAPVDDNVAVGSGAINWRDVIGTAEKVGVTYFIIEDETSDALKNVPISLAYLKDLKI
ncbi:MAG TPA: sugar phosphate isomerase/epimerase [Lacunisphaera sp.]|nr:sugar phosphate isomerase/epimerase [Lacunisphaera sp.]